MGGGRRPPHRFSLRQARRFGGLILERVLRTHGPRESLRYPQENTCAGIAAALPWAHAGSSALVMKLFGNLLLSLLLLALPSLSSVSVATGEPEWAPADAHSCCRPLRSHRCRATCCVEAPANPGGGSASASLPAPSTSSHSLVSPAALLPALWSLPAAPARMMTGAFPRSAGDSPPRLPIFLRHAALLI